MDNRHNTNIQCDPTSLIEVYIERLEAKEHKEMLLLNNLKRRAQYEQTHPTSGYDADEEGNADEPSNKRRCPEKKVDQTDERRKNMRSAEEFPSDDENGDSDEQAQANRALVTQNGNASTSQQPFYTQKTSTPKARERAQPVIIDLCTPPKADEIIDLCTPPKADETTDAPLNIMPTSSKRRLNFHNLDD